jgi:hypothetical protein
MTNLAAFPITRKWLAQQADRLQRYSLPTPNGVKVSIMLEETDLPYHGDMVCVNLRHLPRLLRLWYCPARSCT